MSWASVAYLRCVCLAGVEGISLTSHRDEGACGIGDRPGQDHPSQAKKVCGEDWKSDRRRGQNRKISLSAKPEGSFAFSVKAGKGDDSCSCLAFSYLSWLLLRAAALHALHVPLMGTKPFARVQSYLPKSATQHPLSVALVWRSPFAIPCTSQLDRCSSLVLPGQLRIGRRRGIHYRLERPVLGVEGGVIKQPILSAPF
ncbi:hypothetical protein B0T16DRAFT_125818 [Cercophora newfieldiana]|uniref:Uncharacterized protein n=1 Tax=Cercophora newfieldiana TaxID=92897 RepID=A0AA39YAM2_9PEZI|nr:hypothetical protein B0T16DRAFT_125818 [Cercophora newfieldiana]